MGAYRLSAGCVNLFPTRQSFQPSWQQASVFALQLQYFCIRKKPTRPTDQSVTKQVRRDGLNNRTPSFTSWMMTLDWWNNLSSSSVHLGIVDGLKSARNGFICRIVANADAPWLTNPNQTLATVMSVGVGKFLISSKNFLLGLMFVGLIVSPAKSTVSWVNWILLALRVISFRAHRSNHTHAWKNAAEQLSLPICMCHQHISPCFWNPRW